MRRGKFNVSKVADRTHDGVKFDSKREMNRYLELVKMQEQGRISGLIYHPEAMSINIFDVFGVSKLLFKYEPDFKYTTNEKIVWRRSNRSKVYTWEPGSVVVEDSKGKRTPVYNMKSKAVLIQYGIAIYET